MPYSLFSKKYITFALFGTMPNRIKMEEQEELILTIINHTQFGYLFRPVWVSGDETQSLSILERAEDSSANRPSLTAIQREIILLANRYSDNALMKIYSKETTVPGFLKNVKQETVDSLIRPLIEKYQYRIMERLPQSGLKVFFRESIKIRALFESDRFETPSSPARAVFNFIKNGTDELQYFISLVSENEQINLKDKSFGILSNAPAGVFVDRNLFFFKDIDSKKLLPFFTKNHVVVPAASEKAYIEKFIAGCVKSDVDMNVKGIDIEEIQPKRHARLLLTNGLDSYPVLNLIFLYDGKAYPLDAREKKIVYARQKDGATSLVWFYRDWEWEEGVIDLLKANGLETKWINGFRVKKEEKEEATLIDWIQSHRDLLTPFGIEQDLPGKTYFLGEIALEGDINRKQDWFDLKSEVVFGEFRIPFLCFRNYILNDIREYILPDGSIALLPRKWFTDYFELMFFCKEKGNDIRLNNFYDGSILLPVTETERKPQELLPEELHPLPKGLNATLRPYQHKGFSWLLTLAERHLGGCLADDMGLGKTLQTIALLQHFHLLRKKEKLSRPVKQKPKPNGQLSLFDEDGLSDPASPTYPPSLVVVPASLLHNWKNELERFAPSQKVYLHSGEKRMRSVDLGAYLQLHDVVLTTYGTLRMDIEELKDCPFHHLILDESQYVKNPDSATYQAVMRIAATHKLVLTGTPIENSLADLWAQMNFINEGILSSRKAFRLAYSDPLSKSAGDSEKEEEKKKKKEAALLRIIHPFIMRRTKDEVAPELPPLTEKTIYCDMSERQTETYTTEKNKIRNSLIDEESLANPSNFAFVALQGLTRLRLLANHPKLLDLTYPDDSGKFEQVVMCLETLRESNHKVLVFSSFVKHLRLYSTYFDRNGWKYAWLSGQTNIRDREKEIDRYAREKDVNCFFISIKAGGVGLNLTAADYVLILDPWWNPAVENQAVSRSHRIGQDRHVIVYRFISSGTIEEKIRRLQEKKSKLADTFISSSNPLQSITKEDMDALLG